MAILKGTALLLVSNRPLRNTKRRLISTILLFFRESGNWSGERRFGTATPDREASVLPSVGLYPWPVIAFVRAMLFRFCMGKWILRELQEKAASAGSAWRANLHTRMPHRVPCNDIL
jgi:hypothetical protein